MRENIVKTYCGLRGETALTYVRIPVVGISIIIAVVGSNGSIKANIVRNVSAVLPTGNSLPDLPEGLTISVDDGGGPMHERKVGFPVRPLLEGGVVVVGFRLMHGFFRLEGRSGLPP